MSPEERPMAPSRIASSTSCFILSISSDVGRRLTLPMTSSHTCPLPTYDAMLTEMPWRSRRAKYSPSVVQSRWMPSGSRSLSKVETAGPSTGPAESDSPRISVVTPWRILLSPLPSTRRVKSEWLCRSMKPGATTSPEASIVRLAVACSSRPTSAMRPSFTATEPSNHGLPLPSMMWPCTISRSYSAGAGSWAESRVTRAAMNSNGSKATPTRIPRNGAMVLFDLGNTRVLPQWLSCDAMAAGLFVANLNQQNDGGESQERHGAAPVEYRVEMRWPHHSTRALDQSYDQADTDADGRDNGQDAGKSSHINSSDCSRPSCGIIVLASGMR